VSGLWWCLARRSNWELGTGQLNLGNSKHAVGSRTSECIGARPEPIFSHWCNDTPGDVVSPLHRRGLVPVCAAADGRIVVESLDICRCLARFFQALRNTMTLLYLSHNCAGVRLNPLQSGPRIEAHLHY
jgi:hypothetical protein